MDIVVLDPPTRAGGDRTSCGMQIVRNVQVLYADTAGEAVVVNGRIGAYGSIQTSHPDRIAGLAARYRGQLVGVIANNYIAIPH